MKTFDVPCSDLDILYQFSIIRHCEKFQQRPLPSKSTWYHTKSSFHHTDILFSLIKCPQCFTLLLRFPMLTNDIRFGLFTSV